MDIQNYISKSTDFNVAVSLFNKNGFTEVYNEEYDGYYLFNTIESGMWVKPTIEHLYVFCKDGIVVVIESFNESKINYCNFYFEVSKELFSYRPYLSSTISIDNNPGLECYGVCVNFPHNCFTIKTYDDKRVSPLSFYMANAKISFNEYYEKGYKDKLPDWFNEEYKIE